VRKILLGILFILLFISGLFTTVFGSVLASSELVEDSWSTKSPMNTERTRFGVVAVGGKIYVIGGCVDYGTFLSVNECYDPKTDTWVTLASMPTPRHSFGIVACDGKIYCMGGTFYENGQWFSCKANEVYDPVTNSWSVKKSTPFEGSTEMVQAVNGKIFVMAGNSWRLYDPLKDSWSLKTKPLYVGYVSSAVVNSKIIVYCNVYYWMSPFEAKAMMYDVETDKWSELKTQPFVATLIAASYRYPPVYTIASSGATTGLFAPMSIYSFFEGKTFVHDPLNDTWSTAKDTPANVSGNTAVAVVNDVFYVVGSTFTAQYVPIGYTSGGSIVSDEPSETSGSFFSETSGSFLNSLVIAVVLVLTLGFVVGGLFFYFRKRQRCVL
jgi:N-acetylneuraminic acid mutarotase